MALSANLQAALDAGGRPLWVFEAQLPDATSRWGRASVGTQGDFEPKVLAWGTLDEELSDEKSGELFNPSLTFTLSDTDRRLSNLTRSADANDVRGSTGILYLAAPGVLFADWSERFRGRLAKLQIKAGEAVVTYRQNTIPIKGELLGTDLRIGVSNFPHAHQSAINEVAPLIYGSHNSAAYTNLGFVPALLIDTTGDKRHLVSTGICKDVPRVWKNGTLQTVTTHYTIENREVSGRIYTLIEWTTAAAVADDDEIACDVDGYEVTGDGTGALITNPADQLEHLLINWVFGNYRRGDWDTSSDFVDASSFSTMATWFTARGYSSARRISTAITPRTLLAEWAKSHEARIWWDYPGSGSSGKLVVGVEDAGVLDWYSDTWQPGYIEDGNPLDLKDSDRLETDGVAVQAIFDESKPGYLQSWAVSELTRTNPSEEARPLRWGPAS